MSRTQQSFLAVKLSPKTNQHLLKRVFTNKDFMYKFIGPDFDAHWRDARRSLASCSNDRRKIQTSQMKLQITKRRHLKLLDLKMTLENNEIRSRVLSKTSLAGWHPNEDCLSRAQPSSCIFAWSVTRHWVSRVTHFQVLSQESSTPKKDAGQYTRVNTRWSIHAGQYMQIFSAIYHMQHLSWLFSLLHLLKSSVLFHRVQQDSYH